MPPYRARLGGMFGSGYFSAPVNPIDVGGAISAIGREATSLLTTRYLQKVAEENRTRAAKAAEQATLAQRAEREQRLTMDRERLALDRQRLEKPAPQPVWAREGFASRDEYIAFQRDLADARRGPERTPTPRTPTRPEQDAADEEADAAVWFESQKKNPEVAALLGVVFRANPQLAQTPSKAYAIVRRNYERGQGGGTSPSASGAARPIPRPNGEQEKSYQYWTYMRTAAPDLDRLESTIRGDRLSAALLLPDAAGVRLLTPDEQVFYRAARAFGAGVLRKETGAAFGQNEVRDLFARFIPLSGDTPQLIAAKRRARAEVLSVMGDLALPARQFYDAAKGGRSTTTTLPPEDVDAALNAILSGGRP